MKDTTECSENKNMKDFFIDTANEIAHKHKDFTDGCRVLFLIQRTSDGGHSNNSKLRSYISKNSEEWVYTLAKLLQEKADYPQMSLRIYQSLNTRNVEKGIMHFKHTMLDADYYNKEQKQWFYLDVRNRIVSALMKPACADSSLFLYDIDTKDEYLVLDFKTLLSSQTKIIHEYETKNGYHIITYPFDPNLFICPLYVDLKKDALMLLDY